MKKSNILTFIFGGLFYCVVTTILLFIFSIPKKEEIKFNKAPEGFAVMIYDENVQDYVESENLPIGSYKLNSDKSYCANGGKIDSYDSKNAKVNYSIEGTDECVIYLDIANYKIELQQNGYTFVWTKYDSAVSYNIYSNNELILNTTNTEANIYELYDSAGTYDITVKAVFLDGTEEKYENTIEYTLEQTLPTEVDGNSKYLSSPITGYLGVILPKFDYIYVLNYYDYSVVKGISYAMDARTASIVDYNICITNPDMCTKYIIQPGQTIDLTNCNKSERPSQTCPENAITYTYGDTDYYLNYLSEGSSYHTYVQYIEYGKVKSAWQFYGQYASHSPIPI